MRKDRYKLIGILLFTALMTILGLIGYIRDSDAEFFFIAVMEGLAPYGYCLLSNRKKKDYVEEFTLSSCIVFLLKFFVGSLIGVFAVIPMLWILITNVKKENEEFSERAIYFTNKIDAGERMITGLNKRFSEKYLPVLEKYPECLSESKNALSLLVELNQLQNKLYRIQLYEGKVFYSGLISTFIINLRLKKVFNQLDKVYVKLADYSNMMSKQDYREEDDACLCAWAEDLDYYTACSDKDIEEAAWAIAKHQEMFSFFMKRDLIVLIIGGLFLLSL